MVEFSVPKAGGVAIAVVSFIKLIEGSLIHDFFIWVSFGLLAPLFNIVFDWYVYIISILSGFIFYRYVKHAGYLAIFMIFVFLFIKFGLDALGVGSVS